MTDAERDLLLALAETLARMTEHYAQPDTSPIRPLIAAVRRERERAAVEMGR